MKRIIVASVALAAAAATVPFFAADAPAAEATPPVEYDAPTHQRLDTTNGPVHVWTPSGYDAQTAGVVVYVHGFYTDVDRAWNDHALAKQFAESGINALFVVPAAPSAPDQPVRWPALAPLLAEADRAAPRGLPRGRVVVAGHSGAHRTIRGWLGDERVDTLVILDDVYEDNMHAFKAWLDASPSRRFLTTAIATTRTTDRFHAMVPDTLVVDAFPPPTAGHVSGADEARAVYVKSQHDHMALVTKGVALPMLLRATTLPTVQHKQRSDAISAL